MKPLAIAVLLSLSLSACGGSSDDGDEPKKSDPWPARIQKWEQENAIAYDAVTGTEVKFGSSLWVETSLPSDDEAKTAAEPICGGYSTIVMDHPKIETVTVRSAAGTELAKCGPGA